MTDKQNAQPAGYTAASLAKEAGVSRVHIAWLCRNNKMKCDRVGGVWFIPFEVGAAWLAARKAKSQP